jgi:integrase/recombinase XerD
VSADAIDLLAAELPPETADFSLAPDEVAKGERAVEACLDSLKAPDQRRASEDALDSLAAVISGGVCDARSFPWQQVRAYHAALALSILKEKGAPAHVEALRCRRDENRRFQHRPDRFTPKQMQRFRLVLRRILEQCLSLGYVREEEPKKGIVKLPKAAGQRKGSRGRQLDVGEVRALLAACSLDASPSGCRDTLILTLAYQGGLKTADLVNFVLDDLHFDNHTSKVALRVRQAQSKRSRRIPLENEALIAIEDWLEVRGRDTGPLFCPVTREQRVELRRLTANDVREICEQRAVQAGVQPFAPNDLTRSGPVAEAGARSRRTSAGASSTRKRPLTHKAALYETEDVPEEERIHFPYPIRLGNS